GSAADRNHLEFDELRLSGRVRCGKSVNGPVGRARKARWQRIRGDVACLMRRFGIGGAERLALLQVQPAVAPGCVRSETRQHLLACSRIVNGSALRQDVRAMLPVSEPEAETAQDEIGGF